MGKQRLDIVLVNRDLCSSRQQARQLILAGKVRVNQQIVDKPGTAVDPVAAIAVQPSPRYVSRGGQKLEKALATFEVAVEGRICLDGGISTGGFTDCLLQAGAERVYGVDVGYGQVAWQLRQDDRVILRERTNLRHLQPADLYGEAIAADLAVVDVSFIALSKVLPALWQLLRSPREAILLVKPQFEVGRDRVGKKGVVRNPQDHAQAIFQVCQSATELGWQYRDLTWSPITGPAGNVEYLLWLTAGEPSPLTRECFSQSTSLPLENLGFNEPVENQAQNSNLKSIHLNESFPPLTLANAQDLAQEAIAHFKSLKTDGPKRS